MEFIDLKYQQSLIRENIQKAIDQIFDHGQYIMGPEVTELEAQLALFTNSNYCVSCSSGTDALYMALMAYDIGPGDLVYTSPFTFIATAEVISLTGATPVFVDVNSFTFNIDPEKLEQAISSDGIKGEPRAILGVDIFGLPADYEQIETIGTKHDLIIIEDAAQSFGAEYRGRKAGSFGHLRATSFFPAKPLGCYGDGGAIFTDDEGIKDKLLSIRVHGQGKDKYENTRLGLNGRLDTLQAGILLEKLKIFSNEFNQRQKIARLYNQYLENCVTPQLIPDGYLSAWAQYSVLAENSIVRTEIQKALQLKNVPTAVYYKTPLHLQEAFAYLGYKQGDFPVSEDISTRILSLPMHPYLTEQEIITVCSAVQESILSVV
ncbi:MAG: DegT/DnrJ/EryC1/StrS family aminotransferase [Candidatus Marinimicrobia bacterium]|nr:DegT/DnrJ/EryC1/StrS family aminotransferase [Candidatus Neomarinimicrobiota bacterium]